jgi:NAD(P)-dependent dehydrogenase (short-subunit alcohol dehydrogenase family)
MSRPRLGGVAVVTGGGRGLGQSLARALAEHGMSVAISGRDAAVLEQAASGLRRSGARACAIAGDITDPDAVDRLVQAATTELGPINLLVNNAGVTEHGPVWETDPDEWWRVVEVNLRGPFLCSRAVLPGMIERGLGRIVNVSSGVGNLASADQSAYSVSKAALTRLTDSLAAQTSGHGVHVFAISPGLIRTDMGVSLAQRRGDIREADFGTMELSARLVLRIAGGDLDRLSGRYLMARDDIDSLLARADEIELRDALQLRLRELGSEP